MTATRSTKEEYRYRRHRRANPDVGCPFCAIKPGQDQFIEESESFIVIKNLFPYSLWDGQGVEDHLMLVPKKHTDRLGGLQPEEAVEYLRMIEKYEALDYSPYARVPGSNTKSIEHQHTHLLKGNNKSHKLLLLIRRPFYLRIGL